MANLDHVPEVNGVVLNGRDVSDELALRARLEAHMVRDGLTGVANRAALSEDLRQRCSQRTSDPFGVVVMDVVGMAAINDHIGHVKGDFVLRTVAVRLQAAAPDGAVVARTSGDEFAVVLPAVATPEDALTAATTLVEVFDEPVVIPGGGAFGISVNAGVA